MKKPKTKSSANSPTINGTAEDKKETVTITAAAWSGPLPPPNALQEFDTVVENGAERIMRQWEQESDHRRQVERAEINIWGRNQTLGKTYAFAFVILALLVTAFAIYMQQPWAAMLLGGGTIASVVWAFVTTSHKPNNPK